MPDGNTPVWDVGGGDGTTVHGQRGDLPKAAEKTDTLPVLWIRVYRGVNQGTQTAYAWVGATN